MNRSTLRTIARNKWKDLAKWNYEQNADDRIRRTEIMKEVHKEHTRTYKSIPSKSARRLKFIGIRPKDL